MHMLRDSERVAGKRAKRRKELLMGLRRGFRCKRLDGQLLVSVATIKSVRAGPTVGQRLSFDGKSKLSTVQVKNRL